MENLWDWTFLYFSTPSLFWYGIIFFIVGGILFDEDIYVFFVFLAINWINNKKWIIFAQVKERFIHLTRNANQHCPMEEITTQRIWNVYYNLYFPYLFIRIHVTLCAKQTIPLSVLARNQTMAWAHDLDATRSRKGTPEELDKGTQRRQLAKGDASGQSTLDSRID